jgi:hypothetical protein
MCVRACMHVSVRVSVRARSCERARPRGRYHAIAASFDPAFVLPWSSPSARLYCASRCPAAAAFAYSAAAACHVPLHAVAAGRRDRDGRADLPGGDARGLLARWRQPRDARLVQRCQVRLRACHRGQGVAPLAARCGVVRLCAPTRPGIPACSLSAAREYQWIASAQRRWRSRSSARLNCVAQ